jgi:extradiol dioxygenase family protein
VLPWEEWHQLAKRLTEDGMDFHIAPHIRFEGEVGEQATMFFADPSGNMLEFKSFRNINHLFKS